MRQSSPERRQPAGKDQEWSYMKIDKSLTKEMLLGYKPLRAAKMEMAKVGGDYVKLSDDEVMAMGEDPTDFDIYKTPKDKHDMLLKHWADTGNARLQSREAQEKLSSYGKAAEDVISAEKPMSGNSLGHQLGNTEGFSKGGEFEGS